MKIFQAFGGTRREIVHTIMPLDPGVKLLDGTRRKESWTPFPVKIIKNDEYGRPYTRSLCPSLCMGHALILREEAVLRLRPFLSDFGEFLPLQCDEPLQVWHPLRVIDAVDLNECQTWRFSDGRIMNIESYFFIRERLEGIEIFKIPHLNPCPIFFTEKAKDIITGEVGDDLLFKQVWSYAATQPNQSPEPTTTAVMPAAEQPSRRP